MPPLNNSRLSNAVSRSTLEMPLIWIVRASQS
jgi:hypothetical protein